MTLLDVTYVIFDGQYYKIGITSNLWLRMLQIKGSNPRDIEVVYLYRGSSSERILHRILKPFHMTGEWFECNRHHIDDAHSQIDSANVITYDRIVFDYRLSNQAIHGSGASLGSNIIRKQIYDLLGVPELNERRKPENEANAEYIPY